VCLPLLISPCTIKSRSSLLALAHLGGPRKRAVKRLWCVVVVEVVVVAEVVIIIVVVVSVSVSVVILV